LGRFASPSCALRPAQREKEVEKEKTASELSQKRELRLTDHTGRGSERAVRKPGSEPVRGPTSWMARSSKEIPN